MFQKISFYQQGARVSVVKDGQLIMDLEWNAAREFAGALQAVSLQAEEWAKCEQVVIDQAILLRAGSNLPLATHPKIQAEALKESRWNSMLRRFMPSRSMPEKIGRLQVKKG